MTVSTASAPVIPSEIDWTALSTSSRWTMRQVAFPIVLGYTEPEIASRLGRTRGFVKARLEALRVEILGESIGVVTCTVASTCNRSGEGLGASRKSAA